MDTVNKEFSPLTEATGALMDKLDKRIIIAIIVIILIIIAEFVTHGAPSYEIPPESPSGVVDVSTLDTLGVKDFEQLNTKQTEVVPSPKPVPTPPKPVITGDKYDWLVAAGIPESQWGYVDSIISRESGWQPLVWNHGGSGAYGLCQSLPAHKMASAGADYMTNPVTQLRWCDSYAKARYGSWANAVAFWNVNHWW